MKRVRVLGASAGSWWLALRLDDLGLAVELTVPNVPDTPVNPRAARVPLGRLHQLARYSRLSREAYLTAVGARPLNEVQFNGAHSRSLLETAYRLVDEAAVRALLQNEWLARGHLVYSMERADPRLWLRQQPDALHFYNERGARWRDATAVPETERHERMFTCTRHLPQLRVPAHGVEIWFRSNHVSLMLEPAPPGAVLYIEARSAAKLGEICDELESRASVGNGGAWSQFVQRVRPALLATRADLHSAPTVIGFRALSGSAQTLAWGSSLGALPPLFHLELDEELRQVELVAQHLRRLAPPQLQLRLRQSFQQTTRWLGLWRQLLADGWLGPLVRRSAALSPSIGRQWLRVPF